MTKVEATHFDGIAFSSMSNTYLLECFDTLCERTARTSAHSDDWISEWRSCKEEILKRMEGRE